MSNPRQGSRHTALILAPILALTLAIVFVSTAEARVYWSNASPTNTIGRAALDGTGADKNFITGVSPTGMTVDAAHIYWANSDTIGRANLDGTGVDKNFITGANPIGPVAVDGAHIYWMNLKDGLGPYSIGRANLDGSGVEIEFITAGRRGVAVDGAHIYWASRAPLDPDPNGYIARANLDGSGVELDFITGADFPVGVAVDGAHVYWTNSPGVGSTRSEAAIGRANLDGSGVDQNFISTGTGHPNASPREIAVDGAHLYWSYWPEDATGAIGRANLDGSGVELDFITGADFPVGVAVDALPDVPPNTSIDSGPEAPTNNSLPTFTFSSNEESATFECSIETDTPSFGPCSGEGSHTPEEPLAEGSYTFEVRAVDTEEMTDPTPATRSFVVDLTAPAAPTIGATEPPSPANDNQPTVVGAAEAASTVRIYESSDCSGPSASEGSTASFEAPGLTVTVTEDQTTLLSATATDAAANTSPCSTSFAYTEDSTPPATQVDTGPSGLTSNTLPTFTFSSEPGATFDCQLDGGGFRPCTSPLFILPILIITPLADGSYTFEVRAVDGAGNTDPTPASRSFTVDTTPPESSIDSGPSGPTNDDAPTFEFSSNEQIVDFECSLDGAAYSLCTSPLTTDPLADGSHTFKVQATDEAGNTDPSPASRAFTVDTTASAPPASRLPGTGVPALGALAPDTVPPNAKLFGKRRQEAGKPIEIKVSCAEDCAVVANGRVVVWGGPHGGAARAAGRPRAKFGLRKVTRQLSAGKRATLRLRLKSKMAKHRLGRLLRSGKKARGRIRVNYANRAGNASTARMTIRLRRG